MEGKLMNVVWKDEDIQKSFKDLGIMISDIHKLLELTNKRLNILEQYNFKKPLVLTKDMEVKN
jgi:DNA-binding transcriptional MerR regulator